MSPKVSATLGQPIIVDNRSGANGNIATATLAKAEPEGQTIMLGAIGQHSVAPSLYTDLPFNVARDIAPLTKVSNATNILCLHPSVAAGNVRELILLAKSGSLNGGSAGVGNTGHLAIEQANIKAE
jgi:tripartite-type tricarboxylate transporter receptor subunit TctC